MTVALLPGQVCDCRVHIAHTGTGAIRNENSSFAGQRRQESQPG